MIIHKAVKWATDDVPLPVWTGLFLFMAWMTTITLLLLPLLGVIGPEGKGGWDHGNQNATLVFGSLLGLATVISSGIWWYDREEDWDKRKKQRAVEQGHRAMANRMHVRQLEQEAGLEPWPFDDDIDKQIELSNRYGHRYRDMYGNPIMPLVHKNLAQMRAEMDQQIYLDRIRQQNV